MTVRVAPRPFVFTLTLLIALTATLGAEDWPQWRGADRLAVWNEDGILERFPAEGLKVTWRVPVGSGYSGPVVADGRVVLLDWQEDPASRTLDGTERVLALDETTGEVLWTYEWATSYRMLMASYAIGPRASATIDGDRVYAVGATGRLACLEVATGRLVWSVDYVGDYDASVPTWGVTSAPLVDGDRLIAIVGGEPDALVVAFDKRDGTELWRSLDVVTEAGYGQPVIYRAGGVRQLIVWHPGGLASLDPLTGALYWEHEWGTDDGITIATPVKSDNYLLVSQLYRGSLMLRLSTDRPSAELLWMGQSRRYEPDQTDGLHAMTSTPIIIGDHVYGVGAHGELRGLDARSGERLWMSDRMMTQASFATAFLVRQGERYFVNNDDGELIIARFTPQGYVEVDRASLIDPTSRPAPGHGPDRLVNWVHPAYANRHVIQRNDREVVRVSLDASDY